MIMHSKVIQLFTDSAGALLSAFASAMFISNVAGAGWVPPRDPLFGISMAALFWAVGAVELAVGLVCIFGKQTWLKTSLIIWLAATFLVYQIGLLCAAGLRSFSGYWGNLAITFDVAPSTASWVPTAVFVYLLTGSVASLLWCRMQTTPRVT
jgi:hypothetical protein